MKKMISFVIVIVLLVILIFIVKAKLFPKYDEIEVTGRYEVTSEDYWITEDIEEPFLKDGSKRELQVRAWYPLNYTEETKLPVVVASHGSCGTIDNNRSLYREFASHGYVVLAVAHPGHAASMLHSNGKKQSVSMEYMKEMSSMDPQTKLEDAYQKFAGWMKLRMTDMDYVMNEFAERAAREADKYASADTGHFVVVGHSAGGSTALGVARVRKDVVGVVALESPCMYDIKGVANGDYIIDDSDYDIPVLNVYSDSSYSHLREWKQYRNNVKFLDSENPDYINIYYAGVGHMGLCDLSMASPIFARILDQQKSTVPPREQLTRLNEDCLKFLKSITYR